jgi:DNA polymerase III subunit gamma/tau
VVGLDENILTLQFPRPGDVKGFQSSGYEDLLKTVLVQRFGLHAMIKAISGGDPPPGRSAPRPATQPPAGGFTPPEPANQGRPDAETTGAPAPATAAAPAPASADRGDGPRSPSAADEAPWPSAPEPVSAPAFVDDIPDESDMAAPSSDLVTGMALIERELGGQVIAEIDD